MSVIKKLILGVSLAICCVEIGYGNGYAQQFAGDTKYIDTERGIYNIGDPYTSKTTVDEQKTTGSTYNYLYFGKIPRSPSGSYDVTDKEMYWRVLNTIANDDESTPALFVLTEYGYPTMRGWNASGGKTYAGSDVQTFLNSTMYGECFSDKEKEVILSTSKTESGNDKSHTSEIFEYAPCSLSSQKMFLLSMKEAENHAYGFTNTTSQDYFAYTTDTNRICEQGASGRGNVVWWLRSGYSYFSNLVACVDAGGRVACSNSNDFQYAVRGALNINLASVILTSKASVASPSTTLVSLNGNAPYATARSDEATANASKLTIYDANRSEFSVSPTSQTALAGESVTFTYNGATKGDFITVLLYDKNSKKDTVYYGCITPASTATDSTVTFTIPELELGEYTLKIMCEQCNGATRTNYAGYKDVELTVVAHSQNGISVNINSDKTVLNSKSWTILKQFFINVIFSVYRIFRLIYI